MVTFCVKKFPVKTGCQNISPNRFRWYSTFVNQLRKSREYENSEILAFDGILVNRLYWNIAFHDQNRNIEI